MTRIACLALLASGALACSASDSLSGAQPPERGAPTPNAQPSALWSESFDHREQLGRLEGSALLDTNLGLLTLPAEPMPASSARGELSLMSGLPGGLARADVVVIPEGVSVEAPDAVEIQGGDTVRIAGELRAGPGGILVSAERRIEITGRITALGPIELVIRAPDGQVVIDGELLASAGGAESGDARVEVRGRGALRVGGSVRVENTVEAYEGPAPTVRAAVYGPIELSAGAQIEAGATGRVDLGTTAGVVLAASADLTDEATWTVGAGAFEAEPGSRLSVGPLSVTAETTAVLGAGAVLTSAGEELAVVAGTIALAEDAQMIGLGEGATSLRLEAAQRLEVRTGARLEAQTPTCSRRGQVIVRVAGVFAGLGPVALRSAPVGADCPDADPSGVLVVAHRYEGVFPVLPDASATFGAPRVDPQLRIVVPAIDARTAGRWVSTPFLTSRAPPRLARFDAALPEGTQASVALGAAETADGEGMDFVAWDPANPDAWRRHVGAPFWVIRVELKGRRFDAPVVQGLELSRSR